MKFAIDKIENDTAILENIDDGKILEVNISNLPESISEKDIVRLEKGKYILDIQEKDERLRRIREKFDKLKKLD